MNRPAVRLVIFDMDGLMFDTERLGCTYWQRAALEFGYTVPEALFAKTVGLNREKTDLVFSSHFGSDFPSVAIRTRRWELTASHITAHGVPVKAGLFELLAYLSRKGIPKAVATSTARPQAEGFLNSAGILADFDRVVCGDEIVHSKPDPEIFLKAASTLNVEPSCCLVLEDSPAGITAAHRAGMIPVLIPDMVVPEPDVLALVHRRFGSLEDVIPFIEDLDR